MNTPQLIGLRAMFGLTERLVPRLGSRLAISLWTRVPQRPATADLPPNGEEFAVKSQVGTVRGMIWGSGPIVYLMHGWGGHGAQLVHLIEPLVATGHRVALFDAPSHGSSDPGALGPGRSHGAELGYGLDAVFTRFGPAKAVVAHSGGGTATLMALRDGWLSAERLVFIAPASNLATPLNTFGKIMGFGSRVRTDLDRQIQRVSGYTTEDFELERLAADLAPTPPALIIHDRDDRETSYEETAAAVESWPQATFQATTGLGHRRILRDPEVIEHTVQFVAS